MLSWQAVVSNQLQIIKAALWSMYTALLTALSQRSPVCQIVTCLCTNPLPATPYYQFGLTTHIAMALVNNTLDSLSASPFVEGIPVFIPSPPGEGRADPKPPSLWDMGEDDLTGSEYVNSETNEIPAGNEDRVKYLQNVLLLSQKYLDLWGGHQYKDSNQQWSIEG